eukprot:scaffold108682_cov51-Attheya_sp.AAC.2
MKPPQWQKEQQRLSFGPCRRNNHPASHFVSRRKIIIAISSCPNESLGFLLDLSYTNNQTKGFPRFQGIHGRTESNGADTGATIVIRANFHRVVLS